MKLGAFLIPSLLMIIACTNSWGPLSNPVDDLSPYYEGQPTVATVAAFELLDPTTSDRKVILQATKVAHAESYSFQGSTSEDFASSETEVTQTSSSLVVDLSSSIGGDRWYRSRVKVSGTWSEWTAAKMVTLVPKVPEGLSATQVYGIEAIKLSWTSSSDAEGYDLYWSTTSPVTTGSTKVSDVTSPYTLAGLSNGASYFIGILARNAAGSSDLSSELNTSVDLGYSVSVGDGAITLSWQPTGGASGYNLYFAQGSTVTKASPKWTGSALNTTVATVTGLANGANYSFLVTAVVGANEEDKTSVITATPGTAPTQINAVASGTSVALSWTPFRGATGYNIYQALGATASTGSTLIKTVGTTDSTTVDGLTAGAQYSFVITALGGGESPASAVSTITLVPAPPANLGYNATANSITLTWAASTGSTTQNVYWSASSPLTTSTGTKLSNASSPLVLSGLGPATKYYFLVSSLNQGGESAASALSTITSPAAPVISVTSTTSTSVSLSWASVASATSYNVYWATSSGVTTSSPNKASVSGTSYTVAGLAVGTNYYFVATALNGGGESVTSGQVSGTTRLQYTLSSTAGLGGTVSPPQASVVDSGTPYSINATPNNGYRFGGWSVLSGVATLGNPKSASTTVVLPSGGAAIQAAFVQIGIITTVVGTGTGGYNGDGGPATSATLYNPTGVAVDRAGNVFIGDNANYLVRKVTVAGIVSSVAGNGILGWADDGVVATSTSVGVAGLTIDNSGNLLVADSAHSRVRKVSTSGIISKVAGTGALGYSGDGGLATDATLYTPLGVAIDTRGNLYLADYQNNVCRKVDLQGIITTFAGDGTNGYMGPSEATAAKGDGGPATTAQLSNPRRVAVDSSGNVYIADSSDCRIRKVSVAGTITTVAGSGVRSFGGDGGAATSATLNIPTGIVVDAAGNLYIADSGNNRVRKVSIAGVMSTIAGTGSATFNGDGGLASQASLNDPEDLALDQDGNLYIAETGNHRIRMVTGSGSGVGP